MWPLHVKSKEEYVRLIQGHLDREERKPLTDLIHQAVEDYAGEEEFSAWCSSVAHGMEVENAANLLAKFVERFPLSLHPVQVDLAERLLQSGYLDHGANEARAYLSRVFQQGMPEYMGRFDLVRDGCARSLLMLTSVYTELGARNYSRRVLEFGLMMPLEQYWTSRFQAEHVRLGEELRREDARRFDRQWERFFHENEGAPALAELCEKHNAPILAQRVRVLGDLRQAKPEPLGDEEFLQMLYQTDQGAWVLV